MVAGAGGHDVDLAPEEDGLFKVVRDEEDGGLAPIVHLKQELVHHGLGQASMARNGSSSRSTRGLFIMARAISTRRRIPEEISLG